MLTRAEIIQMERAKIARRQPTDEELRRIPLDRPARVSGRLSEFIQVQDSRQSMAEFASLVQLAKRDGFHTELSQEETGGRFNNLQRGDPDVLRYWLDGQVVVDLRDLGISGRLGPDKRPGLADLMADLSRGERDDVTGTIYLSSEGLSRLSRDQDRIVSAQLLKLMKDANCRLRTPFAVYNPRIESDWRDLREKFEDAAKQSRHLQREHFGPKIRSKAAKGEHVGSQVSPGFIIDITGAKSSGARVFGKWMPYVPHAHIVIRALEEYVRYQGSEYRAAQALRGLVFPFFPPELDWMATRSCLRNCLKTDKGYVITPEVIDGLAGQLALIGTWKWSDILIPNNHQSIVPDELFRQAYALRSRRGGKPRGRAAYFEPLDWDGLLRCVSHDAPRRISGHASDGTWVCDRDYHNGLGLYCFRLDHRIISRPLTEGFLKCLDLRPYAREVFDELQTRSVCIDAEEAMCKHQKTQLSNRLANLENNLGSADPELEESYRRQIKQVKADLRALLRKPAPSPVTLADIDRVQQFLDNLEGEWQKLSPTLRNRLLRLVIDHVEIAYKPGHIQAVVIWKTGFKQKIDIEWQVGNSSRERRWTGEQDRLLKNLWPISTQAVLMAAFPDRIWRGIIARAKKLGLARKVRHYPSYWRPWTADDDARLTELYLANTTVEVIAEELGRSVQAVAGRASMLKINRPSRSRFLKRKLNWEILNFYGFEGASPSVPPIRAV